jgi:hypothetical protein
MSFPKTCSFCLTLRFTFRIGSLARSLHSQSVLAGAVLIGMWLQLFPGAERFSRFYNDTNIRKWISTSGPAHDNGAPEIIFTVFVAMSEAAYTLSLVSDVNFLVVCWFRQSQPDAGPKLITLFPTRWFLARERSSLRTFRETLKRKKETIFFMWKPATDLAEL